MTKFKDLSLSCLFALVSAVGAAQEKPAQAPAAIPQETLKDAPPKTGVAPQQTDKATQYLEMKKEAGVKKLPPTLKKLIQKCMRNKTGVA